jgi:hypothetical protein
MLSGGIRLWTLAPRVRLFWGRVLGHVAQKHQSHFPRSSSFDDFDQRPPRYNISIRNIHFSSCVAGRERASTALLKKKGTTFMAHLL